VIPFAALSGPLPKIGVVVVGFLAAGALLAPDRRLRAAAMLGALVLAPVLLLGEIWHSPQLGIAHRHPLVAAVGALCGLVIVGGLAVLIAKRPSLLALLALLALPFRIPIESAGTTSNLLVPLYLVVASGSLAFIVPAFWPAGRFGRDEPESDPRAGWVERMLALAVVLYGIQATYSLDFQQALQNMVFFYVPFALLFTLLRRLRWDAGLIRRCTVLIAGLAVLFALIGFAEYATKTIILNPKLVVQNDLHTYFTVNSVFFDPDIFGRFLAIVMILLAAVLIFGRRRSEVIATTVVLAILWGGLVLTLSRSSLGALLLGLAVLAALRWKPSWMIVAGAVVVVLGAAAIAISPKTFGLNQGLNGASSGRAGLVSTGVSMFESRPIWGYGSGSFVAEYRARHPNTSSTLAASHTIAITIAAEQGLIGELVYLGLVIVAAVTLLRGARGDPVRAAVAAAFVALVLHTNLYADFLEDPVLWTLLAAGVALAGSSRPLSEPRAVPATEVAPVPA
jgi:putative inorganic carbon (HCO3(-)) transporter